MRTSLSPSVCRAFLGCQIEEVVDELNLSEKIISCHPSSLPLPDHVDCFVALNRSPSRLKFSEALLGVHSTFDGSMILFENVIQVLYRSVSTAVAQRPFLLTVGDRRAVNRCQVSIDHSRLGMGSIAERLAQQPLGSICVAKRFWPFDALRQWPYWFRFHMPYGQKTHLRFQGRGVSPTEGSCRFPLIVLRQTTQPFLATHNSVIPARPSIRQGDEEPVLLALVIALLEFLVYGSGDLRKHASPNHSRASLNLIVEPGLYMLLSFQKASCARKL